MCFSANASFTVSTVLLTGGIIAVKKVKKTSQIPFAIIPLIFSIQQFIEGILWISLRNADHISWQKPATYIFLIFAQIIWPIWVPFSIWLLEKNSIRKKILMVLLWFGIIVSAYLTYCIISYNINSTIAQYHIRYDLDFPHNMVWFSGIFYFIPTVIPPFISSIKRMSIVGIIILASFIISKIFFKEFVISVWCFFAAAISIIILLIASEFNNHLKKHD